MLLLVSPAASDDHVEDSAGMGPEVVDDKSVDDRPTPANSDTCPKATDPVFLDNGEFYLRPEDHWTPDLVIPVRGFTIDLRRSYRTKYAQHGPFGYGWDAPLNRRLRRVAPSGPAETSQLLVFTGNCRIDRFSWDPNDGEWKADGNFSFMEEDTMTGEYVETAPDGITYRYAPQGHLLEIRDVHDNRIEFVWLPQGDYARLGRPARFDASTFFMPSDSTERVYPTTETVLTRGYRLDKIRDPLDREIAFTYYDHGRIWTIEDWTQRVWTYLYDTEHRLEYVVDPEGKRTRYAYTDGAFPYHLTEIYSPELEMGTQPALRNFYDSEGRVDYQHVFQEYGPDPVLDVMETVIVLDYDATPPADDPSGAVQYTSVEITAPVPADPDPTTQVTKRVYGLDENRKVVRLDIETIGVHPNEPAEYTTIWTYNAETGNRTLETRPEGDTIAWTWANPESPLPNATANWAADLTSQTHAPKPTSTEDPLTWTFRYDGVYNQMTKIISPQHEGLSCTVTGGTYQDCWTYFQYETDENEPDYRTLKSVTYPELDTGKANPVAQFEFNGHGQITLYTDPDGRKTKFEYDATNHYLDKVTRGFETGDASTTEFDPDDVGRPTVIRDGNGNETSLTFDKRNLLRFVDSPPIPPATTERQRVEYVYDGNRNLTTINEYNDDASPAIVRTTDFAYNMQDLLIAIVDDAAARTEYEYDGRGNRTDVRDAASPPNHTQILYDERDLPYKTIDAEQRETLFDYHPNGTLAKVTDGADRMTLYDYDGFDRLQTITHVGSGAGDKTEVFEYTKNGLVSKKTTRAGQDSTYAYNDRDELLSVTRPEGLTEFEYSLAGRLMMASNPDVTIAYQYNARNELIEESITALADYPQQGQLPLTFTYDLDPVGNLTGIWHPGDDLQNDAPYKFVPDPLNRLRILTDGDDVTLVENLYDRALSLVEDRIFASGATVHFDYDGPGRVDQITSKDASTTTVLLLDYLLDATGSVDKINDSAGDEIDYTYDKTYQLTGADFAAIPSFDTAIAYDDAGSRTSVDGVSYTLDSTGLNQYTVVGTQTLEYDDGTPGNGNLTSDGNYNYEWTSESRLAKVLDSTDTDQVARYHYDPFGRRIRKRVGLATSETNTWYLWGRDRLLEERGNGGMVENRYVYGDGFAPLRVDIGGAEYDVHTDHLDTPRLLTSDSGDVVWQADYMAFGEAEIDEDPDGDMNNVEFNIRFPGQYYDEETGLHYNRFRYYDPSIGRYISADPIGQRGGINLYNYAANDPVNKFDPTGEAFIVNLSNRPVRTSMNRPGGGQQVFEVPPGSTSGFNDADTLIADDGSVIKVPNPLIIIVTDDESQESFDQDSVDDITPPLPIPDPRFNPRLIPDPEAEFGPFFNPDGTPFEFPKDCP